MKELSEKIYWSLSLPLFELEGMDSRKFLNGQTTADIFDAKEGILFKTCWLSPTGRLKSLLEFRCLDNKVQFVVLRGDSKEVFSSFDNVTEAQNYARAKIKKIFKNLPLCPHAPF